MDHPAPSPRRADAPPASALVRTPARHWRVTVTLVARHWRAAGALAWLRRGVGGASARIFPHFAWRPCDNGVNFAGGASA